MRGPSQRLAPENQRILDRFGVVIGADAPHPEAEAFVEFSRGVIGAPYFEGRALAAGFQGRLQNAAQEVRGETPPSKLRSYREVVDVHLWQQEPCGAVAGDSMPERADHKNTCDGRVIELGLIHLPRPRAEKRLGVDLNDAVEIGGPAQQLDDGEWSGLGHGAQPTRGASDRWRASSASGRRT